MIEFVPILERVSLPGPHIASSEELRAFCDEVEKNKSWQILVERVELDSAEMIEISVMVPKRDHSSDKQELEFIKSPTKELHELLGTLASWIRIVDSPGQAGADDRAQLGAAIPAVEITPEMLKSGVAALAEFAPLGDIDENSILLRGMVREVLIAALSQKKKNWSFVDVPETHVRWILPS